MSHEFELHHLVSELVSLLKVSDTADVDSQVDLLAKNRTPYITTQVLARSHWSSWILDPLPDCIAAQKGGSMTAIYST